jgi:type IV pilus assembly protein PilA
MWNDRDERGFTLIELMVVVLIIAVLIAIAIPTFMGARRTANDRATQANVRNAFTATRVYYNESRKYTTDTTKMADVEPSLLWTTSALDATTPSRAVRIQVFDDPGPAQTVIVVGRSAQGRCFYLKDVMGGAGAGTYYDRKVDDAAQCPSVADPALVSAEGWTS